ncbi:hypothetical protein [Rhodoferax sp. GW822-FHT02A01]|uniref:hypothetical protein n=1 Tax=Rhodoferax sp. GW822-FHT02A01 TaxID=3141537 RepID=UPI00315CF1B0
MREILFRCSSIGKLMTEPVSIDPSLVTDEIAEIQAKKKRTDEEKAILADAKSKTLSEGAKTYIRELVAQEIFGVDFEVSSKPMEKGIRCEGESIALLNRVRGLSLVKNTERRQNGLITGECDLYNAPIRLGHDLKTSWSIGTFPIVVADCKDSIYEWQMRGYMQLWDAQRWSVDYALVNTPDDLIGYEPPAMHFVDHIPEHHRITSWVVERDMEKEAAMAVKIAAARIYYVQVLEEFDRTHRIGAAVAASAASTPPPASPIQVPEVPAIAVEELVF